MSILRRRGVIGSSGGSPPPPADPFDVASYVNADTSDSSPMSTLAIDPVTHRFTIGEDLRPVSLTVVSDLFDADSSGHFHPWTEDPWTGQGDVSARTVTVTGSAVWLPWSNTWFYDDRAEVVGDVTVKFQVKNTGYMNSFHVALGYQPGDNDAINAYIDLSGAGTIHIHRASDYPSTADFALSGDATWPALGFGGYLNKWVEFKRVGNDVTLTLYDTNGSAILKQTTATIPAPLQARFGAGTSGFGASGAAVGNPLGSGPDYVHHWDNWTIFGVILRHYEFSYGFMYLPTAGMTDDVEVVEKVFIGHNSEGTLQALHGDQRWNPTAGIGGKITPGSESSGIGLFGALANGHIEVDYYNYMTFGGWKEFDDTGGPFGGDGDSTTTIEAGAALHAGTHYYGVPVVAHVPMTTHGGYSEFDGYDEYNPLTLAIDTFYWLVLRLVDNRIEFEVWLADPAGPGNDFLVKMVTTLTDPDAIALFGSGAPGGIGPIGWFSPPPHSYIESWSYTLL